MGIPEYQDLMGPLLHLAGDKERHSLREAIQQLADQFDLDEEERTKLLPSGTQPVFENRVGWAKTYLKKAGLLRYPERGSFEITERGLKVLERDPDRIDNDYLKRFEAFQEFRRASDSSGEPEEIEEEHKTPLEKLEDAHQALEDELKAEVLDELRRVDPTRFEHIVIDLLVAMGYGGSREDVGRNIGGSGDQGVDGLINEDRLGLDVLYVQAKRWSDNKVGSREIRDFVGALEMKKAKKGVFITTTDFSQGAKEVANQIGKRVVLVDGETLATYMVEHNVGVIEADTYRVKELDFDYF